MALNIPPVTRNLMLVNVACFLIQQLLRTQGIDITRWLGLHFVLASDFNVLQLVTYMFLHGGWVHLFFNMFALWMFGGIIERTLGVRRFLTYYFVCGIGAGLCQELMQTAEYFLYDWGIPPMITLETGQPIPRDIYYKFMNTIGASGACYGVLLAFGMLYPNERLMLIIPPIPMKAKYFVAGYAVIEVIMAYRSDDNVAHFAHLGGMLFGWLLLRYWRRRAGRRAAAGAWAQWDEPHKRSLGERTRAWWDGLTGRRTTTPGNAHHTATRPETDREYNQRRQQEEQRMDEILDKINRSGYDSLTPQERKDLFRMSRGGKP